jgi:hypothetical protein
MWPPARKDVMMSRYLPLWAVIFVVASVQGVELTDQLVYALHGIRAREVAIPHLSGTMVEHVLRTPTDIARYKQAREASRAKDPSLGRPPAEADASESMTALRFALSRGRLRQELLVMVPGPSDFYGTTTGPPDADPEQFASRAGDLQYLVRNGESEVEYRVREASATVIPQTSIEVDCLQCPIAERLMLSNVGHLLSASLVNALAFLGPRPTGFDDVLWSQDEVKRRCCWITAFEPLRRETLGTADCVVLQTTAFRPDLNFETTFTYWFCEKLGFALVKRRELRTYNHGRVDHEIIDVAEGFKDVAKNVWLPSRTTRTVRGYWDGQADVLFNVVCRRFRELSISEPAAAEFQLQLPIGTLVQDSVALKVYTVGNISGAAPRLRLEDKDLLTAAGGSPVKRP